MHSRTSLSRTRRDHPKILELSEVRLIRDRLWRQLFYLYFHHVWKCVIYIFDCHVYRLHFVWYVLDVFVCFNERINKEISIHKTFIYYSINLIFNMIFNKNECELFKRNKKTISQIIINHVFNKYERKSITSDRIVCQL